MRYGLVTVDRYWALRAEGIHLHVIYQAQDVTRRCCWADDTGDGTAELFILTAKGKPYLRLVDPDERVGVHPGEREVAKELVSGITLEAGDPLI